MIQNAIKDAYRNTYQQWSVSKVERPLLIRKYPTFVDRQIIITGRREDIKMVVDEINAERIAADSKRLPWKLLAKIELDMILSFLQEKGVRPLTGLPGVEIHLYDLVGPEYDQAGDAGEVKMWEAVRLVHEKAKAHKFIVFADPNLIIGNPASGGAGGVNGGPFSIPVGITGKKGMTPQDRFWEQWAFFPFYANSDSRRHGVKLEKRGTPRNDPARRLINETGRGVRIFVLDAADSGLMAEPPETLHLPDSQKTIPLSVFNLQPFVDLPKLGFDVSPHGRFICGLLNRVAPEAEINLWRVLDEGGHGELFTLIGALFLVAVSGMMEPSPDADSPLNNVVVNLSLVAGLPEDRILSQEVRQAIDNLWDTVQAEKTYQAPSVPGEAPDILDELLDDIYNRFFYGPSLRIPIKLLTSLGAVVVAAAGNESSDRYGNLPALVPARYPEVIGVASSNFYGDMSSFSNTSDIHAPGGGDKEADSPILNLKKLQDRDGDLEPYAICSLVPVDSAFPDGLAYWWGTSFSTPLVAGLAALVMEKHREVCDHGPAPKYVKEQIKDNATRGVIDIAATLGAIKKPDEAPAAGV